MRESDLNRIIKNNFLNQSAWADKINDPAGISAKIASPNPFDGFAYSKGFDLAWESKLIKDEYSAFAFSSIRPHQISNLTTIKEIVKDRKVPVLCLILLGIYLPRCGIDLFAFDINYINELMKTKKSILKKELLQLKDDNKYMKIKSKEFNINELKEKVIYD